MITISDTIKDEKSCNYLKDYNEFFQLITRKLYVARFHHGMSVNEAKSYFIANYKISAREFNSVRNQLEARIKSLNELNKIAIDELKHQIAAIESGKKSQLSKNKKNQSLLKSIATYRSKVKRWKLERKGKRPKPPKSIDKIYEKDLYQSIAKNNNWIKQKDIRLKKLIQNLKIKENEIGIPKICFGSRNMFKKQFNLGDNGYKSHNDWKEDWTRSNQIKHIWSFWSRHKRLLSSLGPEYKIHQKEWERKLTLLSHHPSGFTAHREVVDSVFDLSSSGLRRRGSSPLRSIQVPATLTVRVASCVMQYELT